jgi:RimJ/RimL family protein N-acetyltransferase
MSGYVRRHRSEATHGSREITSRWKRSGYILAREHWGRGHATLAAIAMVDLARSLGLDRIEADCHVDHLASARVLHKAGLAREGVLRSFARYPNLGAAGPSDVFLFGLALA